MADETSIPTISKEVIYEQQCLEFRSLNGFFWQIPLIMMTLNGGLWYSVASLPLDTATRRGILWFAVVANIVMIFGLHRLRSVMATLLHSIHKMEGTDPMAQPRLIQTLFSLILALAAIGACIAGIDPDGHFSPRSDPRPTPAAAPATSAPHALLGSTPARPPASQPAKSAGR